MSHLRFRDQPSRLGWASQHENMTKFVFFALQMCSCLTCTNNTPEPRFGRKIERRDVLRWLMNNAANLSQCCGKDEGYVADRSYYSCNLAFRSRTKEQVTTHLTTCIKVVFRRFDPKFCHYVVSRKTKSPFFSLKCDSPRVFDKSVRTAMHKYLYSETSQHFLCATTEMRNRSCR